MLNWEMDLEKLNIKIVPVDNPNLIQLTTDIKPRFLQYQGLLIPINIKQEYVLKTSINNVVLEIKRLNQRSILVDKIYILNSIHPNAMTLPSNPILDLNFVNNIVYQYCFNKFVFDDENPISFVNQVGYLIKFLEKWNYDEAYWRDFKIIEINIDDHEVCIDPNNNNKMYNKKQLKKKLSRHSKIIHTSIILNKLLGIPRLDIEDTLKKIFLV